MAFEGYKSTSHLAAEKTEALIVKCRLWSRAHGYEQSSESRFPFPDPPVQSSLHFALLPLVVCG